ncbi:elongation factor P lysine(34) lysyltransferase [Saccharobesus litoralis]|uniref:Elongation factor P lysine(34) lysyltransferase n=1 Tax=Saccharobesus litoralis TaxID=2172099 RepID=A0A2S0VNP6_9ALTE|nr:elongation factor P--(R)-beta-lysine ligase [Saccharobesus litoralis]AWB65813.1 elongation factor P lysine(34) lysyltransferase [Saccharobesus litoralis]
MAWQPSASISALKQRANTLAQIRKFFAERDVLEVETPLLASSGVTDLHLENMQSQFYGPGCHQGKTLYLQTSPEYAMKRLLAAGSGCIYQICKAFRNDEAGRHHNPEFTLLEWYRVGFDAKQLMHEVDHLLQQILNCPSADYLTYQQAFMQFTQLDPLDGDLARLKHFLVDNNEADLTTLYQDQANEYDTLLQYIFNQYIEPQIGQQQPCFIYQFPASQAALAKLSAQDSRVAERFEVYFKGIELANGFDELTDANEQRRRFEHDNQLRQEHGLATKPIDEYLLAALKTGIPQCAGVALGIDRLVMLAQQAAHIHEIQSFNITNC